MDMIEYFFLFKVNLLNIRDTVTAILMTGTIIAHLFPDYVLCAYFSNIQSQELILPLRSHSAHRQSLPGSGICPVFHSAYWRSCRNPNHATASLRVGPSADASWIDVSLQMDSKRQECNGYLECCVPPPLCKWGGGKQEVYYYIGHTHQCPESQGL